MKHIIVGTNRQGSNSLKVARYIQRLYLAQGEKVEILDLGDLPVEEIPRGLYGELPDGSRLKKMTDTILESEGLILVVPEYNGSYPGILKLFIDYWKYPEAFVRRPVCFVGLGGLFGGLRPVEHLMQVFSYRNAFLFPERVFLMNVFKQFDGDDLKDPVVADLLKAQVLGFQRFCRTLKSEGLTNPSSS